MVQGIDHKIYDARSKTFFFFDYEGMQLRSADIATYTLPTQLQRQGDFSQTFNASGQMMAIHDPFSTTPDTSRPGAYVRAPFVGNVVPASLLNPVALNMQKYYPQPNTVGLRFTGQNNFVVQSAYPQPESRIEAKIDHCATPVVRRNSVPNRICDLALAVVTRYETLRGRF